MKLKKIVILMVCFVIGLFIVSLTLAYFTNFKDPVTTLFKKVYPAYIIETHPVSIFELDKKIKLAKIIDSDSSNELYVNQIVKNYKLLLLAKKLNVIPDQVFINSELTYYTKNRETEYNNLLSSIFNNNYDSFQENVLMPLATEASLKIKFNTDLSLNNKFYKKAQSLLIEIQQGKQFETVAKESSDDVESGQLGGDLGFFTIDEILPDLKKVITNTKIGNASNEIVVSRFGYHIIYPVETAIKEGTKYWHVKHILIKTEGYEVWLNKQLDQISAWQIK